MLVACTGPTGQVTVAISAINGVIYSVDQMILVMLGAQLDTNADQEVLLKWQKANYGYISLEEEQSIFSMDPTKLVAINLQGPSLFQKRDFSTITFTFTDGAKVEWQVEDGGDPQVSYDTITAAWRKAIDFGGEQRG